MKQLNEEQLTVVSGGNVSEAIDDLVQDWGYAVGYAYGYFYNNVMTSDRWLDDLANTLAK